LAIGREQLSRVESNLHVDFHPLRYSIACAGIPEGSFDSVYAMNSLLHLTKAELPGVLKSIGSLLKPVGLFYMGVYGGIDSEGIREKDVTVPKRFFSFYTDDHLQEVVAEVFDIVHFRKISLENEKSRDFQSLVLRKKQVPDFPKLES